MNDKVRTAKELFGDDIDTTDLTFYGKELRVHAYDHAISEEEIEDVYYSGFANTARGVSLDRLLWLGCLTRNPAEPAQYSVKVTGTAGYTVPVGFLVATETEIMYSSTQAATIGEDGTCLINVECTEAGTDGNVNATSIDRIVNPDASISSVEGVECLYRGVDEESDTVLRERLKSAISGAGSCNENAIRAALLRVPTVKFAAVASNDGDTADADGRPPHSFECYVLGGADYEKEIAQTIWDKRSIGIRTVGNESVVITDATGAEKTVNFSYSPEVAITVKLAIKTNTSYPSDGAAQIEKSLTNYINGLGIGNQLVLSTLYGYVYAVPGVVEVTSIQLSTDGGGTYSTGNVNVPIYGVAVCAGVLVEVTG